MAIKLQTAKNIENALENLSSVKEHILAAAKEAKEAGRHDKIVIELPQGKYTATEPLSLSINENPELASVDITIRAEVPGASEINSLVKMDGKKFEHIEGTNTFVYQFEKDENGKYPLFRDYFLRNHPISMTKSPIWRNLDPLTDDERDGKVKREGFWAPIEIAKKVASEDIGSTEIVMYIEWVFASFHVEKVDLSKTKTVKGEEYALVVLKEGQMDTFCQTFGRHLNIGNREMFFRNTPAYLELNTFAYDYFNGKFYIDPEYPEYMWCHPLEYPAHETLIELDGIENFTVEGVSFLGTTCKYGCENVYRCGQANNISSLPDKRVHAAAIFTRNVRGLTLDGCTFKELGTNALLSVDRSVRTTVKNCRFVDVSMSAVAVGNPTWDWNDTKNRTFNLTVENNYMQHIAYEYPAAPAIYVTQVDGLKIMHNTVIDCAYSAVSVGWTWSPADFEIGERVNIREAEIAYNYFRNFMQLLKDGGAVYVLGGNANRETTPERINCMHDNYAEQDVLVKEYGKYGYYLDGASSNWEVANSVVINVDGMPIFSQPHPGSLTYHNTFRNVYSTTPAHISSHVPERDVVTRDYHLVEEGPEALLEKHPETKAIRDAAGCSLVV